LVPTPRVDRISQNARAPFGRSRLADTGWSVELPGLGLAVLAVLVIASEFTRTLPRDWLWDFGSFVESGRAAKQGLNPFGIYPLTFHVVLPASRAGTQPQPADLRPSLPAF
jgi:hypothetical protein